ncbi:hypothetical protein GFL09_06525 [Pseudomonas stutzeri]|nr:hypothetical protein [Stutzerimonas stutzeri]HBC00614.1 hypothetical protein [Pseudomonas sp.]
MAGKAFHQDHHHVLNRQPGIGRCLIVSANGRRLRVDQAIIRAQQQIAGDGDGLVGRHRRLPDVVPFGGETAFPGGIQAQHAIQAKLVREHRFGRKRIAPAQGRALAKGAACGDDGNQHAEQQCHTSDRPRTHGSAAALPVRLAAGRLPAPIQPGKDCEYCPAQYRPGQQQTDHRKSMPEHAQHGCRIFLDVLENQPVEALVEFLVEVQLDHAEKYRQARCEVQPVALPAARSH